MLRKATRYQVRGQNIICSKKIYFIFILIIVSLVPLVSIAATTIKNTDQQSHELEIRVSGQSLRHTILEQTTIFDVCRQPCEIVQIISGQTVKVNPSDTVVIRNGLLEVISGDRQ